MLQQLLRTAPGPSAAKAVQTFPSPSHSTFLLHLPLQQCFNPSLGGYTCCFSARNGEILNRNIEICNIVNTTCLSPHFPFWVIIEGDSVKTVLIACIANPFLVYDEERCWHFLADLGSSSEIHTDVSSAIDHKILTWFEATVQRDRASTGFLLFLGDGISMVHLLQAGNFSISVCRILSYHLFSVGTQHFLSLIKKLGEAGQRALKQW